MGGPWTLEDVGWNGQARGDPQYHAPGGGHTSLAHAPAHPCVDPPPLGPGTDPDPGPSAGPALVPALREDGPEGGEEAPLDGDSARKHEAQAPEEPQLLLPTRPPNDVLPMRIVERRTIGMKHSKQADRGPSTLTDHHGL